MWKLFCCKGSKYLNPIMVDMSARSLMPISYNFGIITFGSQYFCIFTKKNIVYLHITNRYNYVEMPKKKNGRFKRNKKSETYLLNKLIIFFVCKNMKTHQPNYYCYFELS